MFKPDDVLRVNTRTFTFVESYESRRACVPLSWRYKQRFILWISTFLSAAILSVIFWRLGLRSSLYCGWFVLGALSVFELILRRSGRSKKLFAYEGQTAEVNFGSAGVQYSLGGKKFACFKWLWVEHVGITNAGLALQFADSTFITLPASAFASLNEKLQIADWLKEQILAAQHRPHTETQWPTHRESKPLCNSMGEQKFVYRNPNVSTIASPRKLDILWHCFCLSVCLQITLLCSGVLQTVLGCVTFLYLTALAVRIPSNLRIRRFQRLTSKEEACVMLTTTGVSVENRAFSHFVFWSEIGKVSIFPDQIVFADQNENIIVSVATAFFESELQVREVEEIARSQLKSLCADDESSNQQNCESITKLTRHELVQSQKIFLRNSYMWAAFLLALEFATIVGFYAFTKMGELKNQSNWVKASVFVAFFGVLIVNVALIKWLQLRRCLRCLNCDKPLIGEKGKIALQTDACGSCGMKVVGDQKSVSPL